MSGCSIADDSTSEELLWRSIATSKEYNININDVKVQPAAWFTIENPAWLCINWKT